VAKRVTSQDVADLAGVSRTTVSFVLNDVKRFNITPETRKKVFDAADKLGYVPNASAQALATQRAKAIGLVMTRRPAYISSDTFLPQIIGGMLDVIKTQKLGLLLEWVEPGHQMRTYRELIRAKHIDGMILLTPRLDDEGLEELENFDIPIVLMGKIPKCNLPSVDIDNREAAQVAVQHLIDLGHTKIACILNAPLPYSSSSERFRGYKDALAQAGIPYDETLVRQADFDPASGYDRMQNLLMFQKDITAVFVASDNVAIGVITALHDAGFQIPEDISVVGFDDIPWAEFSTPPLTTIHTPAQELAQQACFMLLDLMKDKSLDAKAVKLDTQLIVRQSTLSK
jgi:LacI family transcriptional regulator